MFLFFAIAAVFGLSAIVMWLWNAVLPGLIPVHPIGYWQAMGLLVLCKILFGFRGSGGGRKFGGGHPIGEKYQGMNEEERQKFKEEWRQRCRIRSWKMDSKNDEKAE